MGYFDKAIQTKLEDDELAHHGILGQKWGVRRYQNPDGTLTEEGKKRVRQGMPGINKTLQEGKSQVYRKKTIGSIKAAVSDLGVLSGTTAAGAGIGTLAGGPIGGSIGAAAGYFAGIIGGGITAYFVKKHADVKADAIDREYELLSSQMVKELGKTKLSDLEIPDNTKASKEASKPTAVMVTSSEAKKLGLDDSTKFTEKESSDFWKAYAKQAEKSTKNNSTDNKFQDAKKQAAIKDRVSQAKKTNKFDMEFLEQNGDLDPRTGDQLKGKELYDAYEKWLKENQ